MLSHTDQQALAREIAAMDREMVLDELRNFRGSVTLDFTEEFFSTHSLDQLRHILLAARLHLAARVVHTAARDNAN
jgi:hypothetical protein